MAPRFLASSGTEPTQRQLGCRQDFQSFLTWVICFLGFKRRNTSKCIFLSNQLTISSSSLGNFVLLLTYFHTLGTLAQWLKGHEQHPRGGTHPPSGRSPRFKFYFHLGECRENYRKAKRGLHNLVLRRGTWPAPGQWLFQSRLLRTACQTDALARTELQSHAAGTGPIAIEHIKNNSPQHVWAFPIFCLQCSLPPPPHRFCTPHSSTSSFPPAIPPRRPRGASP